MCIDSFLIKLNLKHSLSLSLALAGHLARDLQSNICGHTAGVSQLQIDDGAGPERYTRAAHIPLGLLRANRVHIDGGAGLLLFAPFAAPQAHL